MEYNTPRQAVLILKEANIRIKHGIIFYPKNNNFKNRKEILNAIDYLFDEWDYGCEEITEEMDK